MKKLQFLREAFSLKELPKANKLIGSYLSKMLGGKFVHFIEEFESEGKSYIGVRYVRADANMSVRFNYLENNTAILDSVEIFKADFDKSVNVIEYEENSSIVQVLKGLVAAIKAPGSDESVIFENVTSDAVQGYTTIAFHPKDDDTIARLNESFSVKSTHLDETFEDVLAYIRDGNLSGEGATKTAFSVNIKTPRPYGAALFIAIVETFPDMFEAGKRGKYIASSKLDLDKIENAKQDIIKNSGFTVLHLSSGRVSKQKPTLKNIDQVAAEFVKAEEKPQELERLIFTKQVEHMKSAAGLVLSGVSSLMLVVGEGGLGKTYSVSQELSSKGWKEVTIDELFDVDYSQFPSSLPTVIAPNKTYFIAKGSMSASEAYKAAYYCRNGLLLIDDADDILLSAEGSNLIKGLTDTGKRTVSWKKATPGILTSAKLAAAKLEYVNNLSSLKAYKDASKEEAPDDLSDKEQIAFEKAKEKAAAKYEQMYETIEESLRKEYIPDTFVFEGRVIIISNLSLSDVEPAILTRAITINISATRDELLDFIKNVVAPRIQPTGEGAVKLSDDEKSQLVEMLEKSTRGKLSIRAFVRAVNIYGGIKADGGSIELAARIISRYA